MLIFGAAMILMMIVRNKGILPARQRLYLLDAIARRRKARVPRVQMIPRRISPPQRRFYEPAQHQVMTKPFGGVTAVKNVSFEVEAGIDCRAHWAERRGQDYGVQPHHRELPSR